MYGVPSSNSSYEFNPSCRAQLPSVFTMSKLDMSYQPSTGRSENSDGEQHSTTTTPLNYMRRGTPTAAANRRPEMIQENSRSSEDGSDLDMEKAFKNMQFSASADFFNLNQNNQHLNADQDNGNDGANTGDACSESTAEPWNYADSARNYTAGAAPVGSRADVMGRAAYDSHGLNNFGELSLESRSRDANDFQQLLHNDNPYGQQQQQYQHQREPSPRHLHQQQQQGLSRPGGYRVSPPTVGSGYQQNGQAGLYPQQAQPALSQYGSAGLSAEYGHLIPPPLSMGGGSGGQYPSQLREGSSTTPTAASGFNAPPSTRRSTPASTPTHGNVTAHASYATASQTPLPFVNGGAPPRYGAQQAPPGGAYYGSAGPMRPVNEEYGVRGVAGELDAAYPGAGPSGRTPTNAAVAAGYHSSAAASPRYADGYSLPPQSPHHQQQMNGAAGYHTAAPMMGMPMPPSMPQDVIYQVQFKRGCRSFTLSHRAGITVNERDFVVVEADRGEDIGVVVELMSMQAFMERRMNMARNRDPRDPQQAGDQDDQNVGCILRLATLHERQQLPDKFHTEKDVVQSCNELAMYGFGLPIMVFEAEFQFDRRKLTIYYDCSVRIDFRDFVRQLYSTYKARIWMKKMSPHVAPDVQPFAAMALATGVQFSTGSGISFN